MLEQQTLQSKINLYKLFLSKNVPQGCKSSVEKELNNLIVKYNDISRMV